MRDEVIHEVRQRLDYLKLFEDLGIKLHGQGKERSAKCVFHQDSNPSMSVNVEEGLYFCHNPACGARGDVFTLYMRVRNVDFVEAIQELAGRCGVIVEKVSERMDYDVSPERQRQVLEQFVAAGMTASLNGHAPPPPPPVPDNVKPIDEAVVEAFHRRLLERPEHVEFLAQRRGLTEETIRQFKIGHDGQRYFIPIRNDEGQCVNIRRYKPDASGTDKMISWRPGYGVARIFPITNIESSEPGATLFLMEGEMDCLLANQVGLLAVTTTGGAGTWREPWNEYFRNRHVVICYDNDDAGRQGARHIAEQLVDVALSVKIVTIPLTEPPGADFTDYVHNAQHAVQDFLTLVSHVQSFIRPVEPTPPPIDPNPEVVALSRASEAQWYNKRIVTNAIPSGKTISPYLVPSTVRFTCPLPDLKMCKKCKVDKKGGPMDRRFRFESDEAGTLSEFINVNDSSLERMIKEKSGVPEKCGLVKIERVENMNVEELQLIPDVDRTSAESKYVTRRGIYLGHGLETNRPYCMTMVTVPDPKTQMVTHVVVEAIPAQSSIEAFTLTPEVVDQLKVYQPTDPAGLWRQVDRMYDDMEKYIRIYQRRDLMLAADLTFHSVLAFDFQGERLVRGWVESLILGDTRTGKTTIMKRLTDYYGAGEFSSGENTTKAGLVGGLHQIGTSWALQWGKIVLNDQGLIVIDEASALPLDQIGSMSSMRSSGIVEITKVHTERTHSRTRAIWISNPRAPAGPLSTFSQGVLAVKALIGAPEDIARFDMVVTASSQDVALNVINAERGLAVPEVFTSALSHQRTMWAWSRRPEHVKWDEDAERLALRIATEQGQKYRYATEIPLVEPNEQRVKLARLSVAAAAMFFSTDESGVEVLVKPAHVRFAADFLDRLYAKPSLAFDEYARNATRRNEIHPDNDNAVDVIVRRQPNAVQQLMEQENFTQRDLQEILGYAERDDLRQAISKLREVGFLRRQGSSFYLKTPAAINWLRRRLAGGVGDAVGNLASAMGEVPDEPTF